VIGSRPDLGCAAQRLAHGEPLHGTAPERAASWLLVEHPGPWPSEGRPADLPASVAAVLDEAARRSIRPQLIRPPRERRRDRCTVMVASCRPEQRWLEVRDLADPGALAGLDLEAVAAGRAPGFGTPSPQPVVLVCTHGRHDVCCARRGRPVVRALDARLPGLVWETTHVGGDRFAANVVTLPHGSYHGGVTPDDAALLAAAALRRQVVPGLLRGLAGMPAVAQAAEVLARQRFKLPDLDAVRAAGPAEPVDGALQVPVRIREDGEPGRQVLVRLVARRPAEPRRTSCAGGGTVDRPSVFGLADLLEAPPDPLLHD
jgi:hypothetical protein